MIKKFNVKIISSRGTWNIAEVTADNYEDAARIALSILGLEEADVEIKIVFNGSKKSEGKVIKMHYNVKWPHRILQFYRELKT